MYKKILGIVLFLCIVTFNFSCIDSRKATYFNDTRDANIVPSLADTLSPLIQKNDILSISITSLNAEASAIFNISNNVNASTVTSTGSSLTGAGYLVNSDGNIQLPMLGNMQVAGLTSKEVKDRITAVINEKKLLLDPVVSVHHLNYEVTVLGEVSKPTVINVPNEKISLLKALGLAGDITIYGKKDNVLLIREINGKRKVKRINLNEEDFLTSPFYYLQPNDVIYVEANKSKIANANSFRQTLPIILSGLSLIILALDRVIK